MKLMLTDMFQWHICDITTLQWYHIYDKAGLTSQSTDDSSLWRWSSQPVILLLQQVDIVRFNVPLDTLYVISEILWVRWPNQQCHSTEGWRLVNHVKGSSHQAQLNKRWRLMQKTSTTIDENYKHKVQN